MLTYAEVLRKREMADYDKDEREREQERKEKWPQKVTLKEELDATVTIELPDNIILKYALEAHARDITLNKMFNIALKDALKDVEYRFEHDSKPQFLTENK